MHKNIILTICVLSGFCLKAQVNLDSLYAVWQDPSQADSVRTTAYKDYIFKGFMFSKPDSAFALAGELIAYSKKRDYRKGEAFGINLQGISSQIQGNYPKALEYYKRSLRIQEEIGDENGIAISLNNIGLIYSDQDNYLKALEYQERSLKVREKVGDKKGISGSLNNIGLIYWEQGNYHRALDLFERSLKIDEEIGDKREISMTLNNIGIIYQDQGNNAKALEYYRRSLKIEEEIGDKNGIARSLNNIGIIHNIHGNYPQALDYHQRSLKIKEEIEDKNGIASSLNNIGINYQAHGNKAKALEYYKRSLKIEEEIGDKNGIAISLHNIGGIYDDQGNYPQALDYYHRSLKIREETGDKKGIAQSLGNIGTIYKEQGKYHDALIECHRSLTLSEEIGALAEEEEACQCLYDTYKAMGKGNQALVYLEKLQVIGDSLNAKKTAKTLQQMEFQKQVLADSLATAEETRLVQEAHNEEMRQEEKTRNIGFGIGGLVLLLAVGLYTRLRYVRKSKAIIEKEKDRSNNLLLNILPADIAEELKIHGKAEARDFDMVSILFTDFKGFTRASAKLSAQDLVAEINTCFEAFDGIMEKYSIEKIKTIGDAYMAAGGLPVSSDESVKNTVLATLEMQAFITQRKTDMDAANKLAFEMRVGIHTGPVVAGIVGVKKFQYDIWGDTVNTAARMESAGEVAKVNISQATYELLKDDPELKFESRGKIEAKGKGEIEMYFVSLQTEKI